MLESSFVGVERLGRPDYRYRRDVPRLGRVHASFGRRPYLDPRYISGQHLFDQNAEKSRSRSDHAQIPRGGTGRSCQLGRPDSGVDPTGFYSAEFFVPLQTVRGLALYRGHDRLDSWFALAPAHQVRTDSVHEHQSSTSCYRESIGTFPRSFAITCWKCFPACRARTSIKIIGPDLDELEAIGQRS